MSRDRIARLLVGLLTVVLLVGGCAVITGDQGGDQTATAVFEDVADLADGAPVTMADVRIGNVSSISLDESETMAAVELSFDRDAGVPADVTARVRRTSPLGEKFIELQPETDDPDAPLLEDGAEIPSTEVVGDLEQVVGSGTELFAALGASELAVLLDEGAKGFGGKGPELRRVVDSFATIVDGFAANTDDIELLVTSIEDLASATGPAARSHADALTELARATTTIDEESSELLDLVDALSVLGREGADIMRTHFERVDRQIDGLRSVVRSVVRAQNGLDEILRFAGGHNTALDLGVPGNWAQVLNDFVLCGVPGGGEVDDGGVNDCTPKERG